MKMKVRKGGEKINVVNLLNLYIVASLFVITALIFSASGKLKKPELMVLFFHL